MVEAIARALKTHKTTWLKWFVLLTLAGMLIIWIFDEREIPMKRKRTLFVSQAVLEIEAHPDPAAADHRTKVLSQMALRAGGSACNAAWAKKSLSGDVRLCTITGADPAGNLLFQLASQEFAGPLRIATGVRTRLSTVLRLDRACGTTVCFMNRSAGFDRALTLQALDGLMSECEQWFFGSLTAGDNEFLESVLDRKRPGVTLYLMLSASQAKCKKSRPLLGRVDYLQMNDVELELLAGTKDPVEGARRLREEGLRDVTLVITAARAGVYLFDPSGGTWHTPAFDVPVQSDIGAGDTVAGTILGQLADGEQDRRRMVRRAAAAAALKISGQGLAGGWPEVDRLMTTAATIPLSATQLSKRAMASEAAFSRRFRRFARPLTQAAALVLAFSLGQWMS